MDKEFEFVDKSADMGIEELLNLSIEMNSGVDAAANHGSVAITDVRSGIRSFLL